MAIPIRLNCQCCEWKTAYAGFQEAIAQYLLHMIESHWDILQMVHDDPVLMKVVKYITR